ncbi:MAG: hypothetical protein ACRCYU_02270, partial [Nocardioides sp.]
PMGTARFANDVFDINETASQYTDVTPPPELAGLSRTDQRQTGRPASVVGVYGVGMTQLIAIPGSSRAAGALRRQLRASVLADNVPAGVALTIGPLGVLLTSYRDGSGWLLAGFVDRPTLIRAAGEIRRSRP